MKRRWGLQATMTATYMAVTAAAVLLTELVIFGMAALAPATSAPLRPQQVQGLAQATAAGLAAKLAPSVSQDGTVPSDSLGTVGAPVTPGQAVLDGDTHELRIPYTTTPVCDLAPASFAVVVSRDRTVLATSYPACFPVGGRGADAEGGAPGKVLIRFGWPVGGSGVTNDPTGAVTWVATPIVASAPATKDKAVRGGAAGGGGKAGPDGSVVAMLYLQVPAVAVRTSGYAIPSILAWSGVAVLAGAVPVGLAFGLLSTRRLTRRLKRLAKATMRVADGEFGHRIPVSGGDEVSLLEDSFNRMAGQLRASLDATRQLAEAGARHDERSRIARELHDSISQELFSLQAMAGGLRRTLPPGSDALPVARTMERTAADTMREMQALLLALRPVALDEAGLACAIEGVCRAYGERLGVEVRAELDPEVPSARVLSPAVEHAILRVTQEAVANAVRHSGTELVAVRLLVRQGYVVLEVADDGSGFDVPAQLAGSSGLGLRAMRDRAAEHGGGLDIASSPGAGTTVRASFPLVGGEGGGRSATGLEAG
jgi:signal transduction histidine kinase